MKLNKNPKFFKCGQPLQIFRDSPLKLSAFAQSRVSFAKSTSNTKVQTSKFSELPALKNPLCELNSSRHKMQKGFTLVEVMVAVAILAFSLVAIFGAQFSAVATTSYSRYITQAMQLARCRMNEIELEIKLENGFSEGDVSDSGDCCETMEDEDDAEPFECFWDIEIVEIDNLGEALTGGADAGLTDDFTLGETMPADDGFGAGSMMTAFFPIIGDMLKQAVRRVRVKVEWKQGSKEKKYILSQYLVHPTQGPLQFMHQVETMSNIAGAAGGISDDPSVGGSGN